MPEKTIEVIELRQVRNGNLKAFADIQLGQTIIRDFRVVHQSGQRPWVGPPQVAWKDPSGELKYKAIITFPKELKELVDSMILARYQREMGVMGNEQRGLF